MGNSLPKADFLVLVPPERCRELSAQPVTPAHRAYRLGGGTGLLRAGPLPFVRGGYLAADDRDFSPRCPPQVTAQTMVRECRSRGFSGAVLDLTQPPPAHEGLVSRLDAAFAHSGLTLYLPEDYAPCAPRARIFFSSALSGGSLRRRMEQALSRYGPERTVLALQKTAQSFSLPAPSGSGAPLTGEELSRIMERLHPAVFFSPPLCAKYFTFHGENGAPRLVLLDDGETLQKKVDLAGQVGISLLLGDWAELSGSLFSPT